MIVHLFRILSLFIILVGPMTVLSSPLLAGPPAPPTPPAAPDASAADAPTTKPHPFLGVVASNVDPGLAAHLRIPAGTGLLVENVVPKSGAAAAELQRYDILLRLDDQILVNPSQLASLIGTRAVGDTIKLTLIRAGETLVLPVTLQSRPAGIRLPRHPRPPAPPPVPGSPEAERLGSRQIIITRPDGEDIVISVPKPPALNDLGDRISVAIEQALGDNPDGLTLSDRIAGILAESGVEVDQARLADRMARLKERLADLDTTQLAEDVRRLAEDAAERVRRVTTLRVTESRKVYRGPEGSAELTGPEGARHLSVKDPAGELVYDGPVNTPEQLAALPDLARNLHARLTDPDSYDFQWQPQPD